MARSVVSISMAKTVSCSEKHKSAGLYSPFEIWNRLNITSSKANAGQRKTPFQFLHFRDQESNDTMRKMSRYAKGYIDSKTRSFKNIFRVELLNPQIRAF